MLRTECVVSCYNTSGPLGSIHSISASERYHTTTVCDDQKVANSFKFVLIKNQTLDCTVERILCVALIFPWSPTFNYDSNPKMQLNFSHKTQYHIGTKIKTIELSSILTSNIIVFSTSAFAHSLTHSDFPRHREPTILH